jgi:hypothetical protein
MNVIVEVSSPNSYSKELGFDSWFRAGHHDEGFYDFSPSFLWENSG